MDALETIANRKGIYSVERQFKIIHYESDWPPRSRYMSDLLKKKIINSLREEITSKTFNTPAEIKDYVLKYCSSRVTHEDFGEMADVQPRAEFRVGKGKKFYEYTFQWQNPKKPNESLDPWFSVRITKKD